MPSMLKYAAVSLFIFTLLVTASSQSGQNAFGSTNDSLGGASQSTAITEARRIVTGAYREILHRDPDRSGLETYVRLLVEEHKGEAWIRDSISNSREARNMARERKRRIWTIVFSVGAAGIISAVLYFAVRKSTKSKWLRNVVTDPVRCKNLILVNLALLVAGVAVVIGAFEWSMRKSHGKYDFFQVGRESPDFREGRKDTPIVFMPDSDLGFRPVCGESKYYNSYGTLQNHYELTKRPGVTRLLFIGDSVTHRSQIINALKTIYGVERYEYWNAGVESYNTVQEVGFYRKFNRPIKPDHVILTMVINDMETTPLAFMSEGRLVMVAPNLPRTQINEWLFLHSFVYRQLISWRVKSHDKAFAKSIRNEFIDSLRLLRDELQASNIKFTVLDLPLLAPPQEDPGVTALHRDFENILSNLNIRHFDLAEPFAAAISASTFQDDKIHPTADMGRYLARYLKEKKLLDEP